MLIKFFLNEILLEKIWNEWKKTSFLHKAMCNLVELCFYVHDFLL